MAEDLAAAEARHLPVIAAQPTLRLELPEALQQAPSRLDMCSKCARAVQQLDREARKPVGQRDEELVHKLHVKRNRWGLANAQALRAAYKHSAADWDRDPRQCCGAAQWATQRIATSFRALADFYNQVALQQVRPGCAAGGAA
ncbi:hypothetical protein C2E21_4339 [Chlorella sorokiniana]|uniref:Uncharacterized protein n=1 Tax=Chlorella sorokiniana TaxID=3076 RepID=A0A2P6TSE0_CHLSO|nr:hypothetical protein C2E21_4339 [Chlorella sorokiniana]|eukprot:PRW56979.1 hypothetical protein C2E21_4339 [Chlorella sorokiniana]